MSRRPVVCVQGLGFVGSAMAMATALAKDHAGEPHFEVIGVELPTPSGLNKVENLNNGIFPFKCDDQLLVAAPASARSQGNFRATVDPESYSLADVVIVDIHCDIKGLHEGRPQLELSGLQEAFQLVVSKIKKGGLVIVETTVPPGTCEKILQPILRDTIAKRGFNEDDVLLAHSYERVMPGKQYLNSIINFWRVYSGLTPKAADACEDFLSKVVNTKNFPLTRLSSPTASETAKVLENSYRAVNIALMEEWGHFAEAVNIDLFEVIEAIRMRPTHNNMRQPGFAVGGYCLTKDPLFPELALHQIFNRHDIELNFCKKAVEINSKLPLNTLKLLEQNLNSLSKSRILLLGASYLPNIADTRYSGSEFFYKQLKDRGADVVVHDPMVNCWEELNLQIPGELPSPDRVDALVFAVAHDPYKSMDWTSWLGTCRPLVIDANNVLSKKQRHEFKRHGCVVKSIGRGENCE